jgi:hypothetical protein
MTEQEWLACTDPAPMLEFLRKSECVSERKLRLYMVACCRRIWHLLYLCSQQAVEVAEQYADGLAAWVELEEAVDQLLSDRFSERAPRSDLPNDYLTSQAAYYAAVPLHLDVGTARDTPLKDFLQCVSAAGGFALGGVFSHAVHSGTTTDKASEAKEVERGCQAALLRDLFRYPLRPPAVDQSWLACRDSTVVQLSRAVYDERMLPSGQLDSARLAVLADALEEVSCTDALLLAHLRGPGPHVRGCLAVDQLLGKE